MTNLDLNSLRDQVLGGGAGTPVSTSTPVAANPPQPASPPLPSPRQSGSNQTPWVLAGLAVAAGIAFLLVRPDLSKEERAARDAAQQQAAFDRAFASGDLRGLAGCWRMTSFSDGTGYWDLCFSGRSSVSFSTDIRLHNGGAIRCVPRPGVRVTDAGGGRITIDLPQTSGNSCSFRDRAGDLARTNLVCRQVVGRQDQLSCDVTHYEWQAPQTTTRPPSTARFIRTSEPPPTLQPLPTARVAPPPPPAPVNPPPPAPTARTGPTTWRIGPSFDCSSSRARAEPLPQVICASAELSRLELAYVQAFHAARQDVGQGGQSVVTAKAIEHTAAVTRDCGLRLQGTIPADVVARAVPCVRSSYEAQRRAFQEVVTSQEAREEARRPLERHMAIQEGLRTLGHLPPNEVIDGVYGSATRRAIESFQRSVGLNASGLLSDQTEAMIDSRLRTLGR